FINQANTRQPSSLQEFRITDTAGKVKWFSFLSNLVIKDGQVVGQSGVAQDVTERKRIEEKVEEERILLRTLIDNLPDRIFVMDVQGRKIISNIADWRASGGKTMEDVIGKTDLDTYPPELAEEYWALDKAVIDTGISIINREEPGLDSQGNPVSVLSSKLPLRDGQGKVVGLVGIGHDITERKRAEDTLRLLSSRQEAILASIPDIIMEVDNNKVYTWANHAGREFFGEGVIGKEAAFFFEGEQTPYTDVQPLFEGSDELLYVESWQRRKDGEKRLLAWWCRVLKDPEGNVTGALSTAHDITERKHNELIQNAIYRITQTAITSEGIDALYLSIHSILGELMPAENFFIALYDSVNGLISFPYYIDQYDEPPPAPTPIQGLTGYVIRSGRPLLTTREIFDRLVRQGEVDVVGTAGEDWMGAPLKVEGRMIGVMAVQSYSPEIHFDQDDLNLLEFVSTQVAQAIERKRMEQEILSLSLTDELTGLYNRRGFSLLAEQELKLAHRIKRGMLLFFCDLDDLKIINDNWGHAQGDLALKEVSAILKETFREADIPARIGGDEFVVLAEDASSESADILTNRIQATLERRNQQGDRPYQLTLSMGIARYDPEAPCTVSELIAQADGQMYDQKQAGKGKK
ncbi:MAG: diguanylate cyclase, partial [Planctomycetes bacterium]|nr:diguanylate cyclase [Planctomycetota bacterium]